MNTLVVSMSWLLKIYCSKHGSYIYLFELVFCFLAIDINRNGTARSYVSSIFNFLKKLRTLSIVVATIYIPIKSMRRFPLFTCLQHVIACLFDNSHSDTCEMMFIVIVICFSLMINDVEHLFIFVCLLWKTVYSDPLPFFN